MLALLVLVFISAVSSTVGSIATKQFYDLEHAEKYFEEFIMKFNRKYSNEDKLIRFEHFKEHLKYLNRRNDEEPYAVFIITEIADLSKEELDEKYSCLKTNGSNYGPCNVIKTIAPGYTSIPEEFDWRDHNAVTPVKDQGNCSSCWTFSVTGNIEGQYAIKYNKLQSFSEQQLLDCDSGTCSLGNIMKMAFGYLIQAGGVQTEEDYPYIADPQSCDFDKTKVAVKLADCNEYHLDPTDEESIKTLLYNNGPLSIGIDSRDLHGYDNHMFLNCTFSRLNHAVLLIGYGTDKSTNQPYWLFKNSWGSKWGENGYFRLKRGGNLCGFINSDMSSAVLQ